MRFGSLTVDWPHKNHSKACIPPKGKLGLRHIKLTLYCDGIDNILFISAIACNLYSDIIVEQYYLV